MFSLEISLRFDITKSAKSHLEDPCHRSIVICKHPSELGPSSEGSYGFVLRGVQEFRTNRDTEMEQRFLSKEETYPFWKAPLPRVYIPTPHLTLSISCPPEST